MQSSLKKQADTYFQNILDFQKIHNQQTRIGKLHKFYTLLLTKYLFTQQLIHKIILFHNNKTIQWNVLIDVIWGLSLCFSQNGQYYKALSQFVSQIDRKNIVNRSFLMRSLPENLMEFQNFQKKQILQKNAQRAYRKLYFDQKKYNLLRQNNQGFAKLCLFLATITPSHPIQSIWNKILSLIGNFDLDPDRVLDLLIQTYIQSSYSQIYLNFIKNFNPQSITALLGNRILKQCPLDLTEKIIYAGKIQDFIMTNLNQLHQEFNHYINPKLITLVCQLIQHNIILLQSIIPYLNPQDSIFQRQQSKRLQNGKQKIVKSFKLAMQQQSQQQQQKIKQQQNLKFSGQLLFSSKLAIINGFVMINDWNNFVKLWNIYKGKVDLLIYQPLLKSLLSMLQWIIEPLYAKISYSKYYKSQTSNKITFPTSPNKIPPSPQSQQLKQMTQIHQLTKNQFTKILQLFQIIKIYIGFNCRCFIKICRLFTNIIKQPNIYGLQKPNQSMECQNVYTYVKQKIQYILEYFLFPAVSLQTGNSAMPKQIYQLLQLFDYRFRYKCYLYQYSQGMTINPYLSHIFFKTRNKQIVIVNNLSDKNKRVFMKKIAKLTHNQALQTFYWIFRRILIADYQKVVPQIVGVLSICCTLTLQMSIFVALHILNQQKQPAMNFKTGQQQAWFKNIINFISLFYRKYLQIDIQPVFDYIIMKIAQPVQQLQQNQQLPGSLLKLLHQILSKMFCNFILKQINKNKLQMLCAGPRLQLQAMDISQQIKASKKSKVILQKFFWGKSVDQYDGQSLAISLLVLLTQKRAELLHKSYISNIKIIGDIYDDFTVLIIQLIRVLNQLSSGHAQYAKLLPQNALDLLINQYKLPLQIAFEIYRPSIKHISTMSNQQWLTFTTYIGQVLTRFINTDTKYITRQIDNDKLKSYLNQNYHKLSTILSNQFFTTFWMLTLDSIYFPAKIYTDKIQQVKKKIQQKPTSTRNNNLKLQKNERQIDKLKSHLINIKNQQNQQQKKVQDTLNQINIQKFKIDFLKNTCKDDKNSSIAIQQFAQIFVQICLIPRMMLDPQEALYCMKITMEVIKINKLSSGKSIRLLIYIIQHVMNYLPYSTQRQASYCLSIFLSQTLSIISNWNDLSKLKQVPPSHIQDMKKFLAIQQNFIQQSYPRLKKHFLRLYIRFGNIVKSIKDEPYCIKNCLFLLQKVQSIPAYKKQAQDLQNYLKLLKQKYSTILPTIIQMQLLIIGQKKKILPVIQEQTQLFFTQKNQYTQQSKINNLLSPSIPKIQCGEKKYNGDQSINKQSIQSTKIDQKKQTRKLFDDKKTPQPIQKQKLPPKQPQTKNQLKLLKQLPQSQMLPQKQPIKESIQKKQMIDQKQKQKKKKQQILNQSIVISPPQSQKINTVLPQKKIDIQKIDSKQKLLQSKPQQQQQQPSIQRIKTVKQVRGESVRKQNIMMMQQAQPKQTQPQTYQSNTALYVRTSQIKQGSTASQKLDNLMAQLMVKKKQIEASSSNNRIWSQKQPTRCQNYSRDLSPINPPNIEKYKLIPRQKIINQSNNGTYQNIKNRKDRLNYRNNLQTSRGSSSLKYQTKRSTEEIIRQKYGSGFTQIERQQNRMDKQKLEAGQLQSGQELKIVQKIKSSIRQTGERTTTSNRQQMEIERRLQRKIYLKQKLEIQKRQRQDEDEEEIGEIREIRET